MKLHCIAAMQNNGNAKQGVTVQCMATLAVVKRETKSWKWPLLQLVGMGVLAYLSALIFYQILR